MKINHGFKQLKLDLNSGSYERIGSGSGRWVFKINNEYVVKLAKNKKGVAQNRTENDIWTDSKSELLAEIIKVSDDFEMLYMVKAEKIKNMKDVREYFLVHSNRELLQLQELRDIMSKYQLLPADLIRPTNWGFINNKPVIVDYGFTKEVKRKYYGIL